MANMEREKASKRWSEIAQLTHDWGGLAAYDDPSHAFCIGSIISPTYVGRAEWLKWAHEHYVGSDGYNHETGRITHPKLREFFDKHYPDFEEKKRRREERRRMEDET